MTLSKQLYIIIFTIFFLIFTGNFLISVNNFKNYLEVESATKSQDTATSLGMSLKTLINNKHDSEITSIIRAISNSGFYKEIRLENIEFTFTKEKLLENSKFDSSYSIKDIKINPNYGEIFSSQGDLDLEGELSELENEKVDASVVTNTIYSFIPSKEFNKDKLDISFVILKDTFRTNATVQLNVDRVLVKVTRKEKFDSVPQWFVDFLPMTMKESKTEVSNGWKTEAVLYVSANAGEAYLKLYEQAKGTVYYSFVAFIIIFIVLVLFLNIILKPLKDIENLAKMIYDGNFKTIENLPWTTELKNVSIAMNNMSTKIENVINSLNKNLKKLTTKLSEDELTQLQIEQTFRSDMEHILTLREDGYVFSIKIDALNEFAKKHTNEEVDIFIKEFADILKHCNTNAIAYRFYGSTFAMVVKSIDENQLSQLISHLKNEFSFMSQKYDKANIANIGVVSFNMLSDVDDLLSVANEAYDLSKKIGDNEVYISINNSGMRDEDEWKELVFDIVDNDNFGIKYVNQIVDINNQEKTIIEEAFVDVKDQNDKDIPVGTFISITQEYNKIIELDKKAITKIISFINTKNIQHEILVNVSINSMVDEHFNNWLEGVLENNPDIAKKLIFGMTAYGSTRDTDGFKKFVDLIHSYNSKVMVKRFEIKFISLDKLKEFKLDYIRLSRDFTSDISSNITQQTFVESICEISKLLNIKVFAESVKTDGDFEYLKSVGISGANR